MTKLPLATVQINGKMCRRGKKRTSKNCKGDGTKRKSRKQVKHENQKNKKEKEYIQQKKGRTNESKKINEGLKKSLQEKQKRKPR